MRPRFTEDPCGEALRKVVAAEVDRTGLLDRAYVRLHAKAAGIVVWAFLSYWMLVIVTPWWWPLCLLSFVLAVAGVAFNIMHDGNHQAFSRHRRVSRLAGMTLELLGGSSLFWIDDHNRKHHSAPNVDPFDGDIDYGSIARMAPSQPWRPWYRHQQHYMWLLYAFIPERWQFYLDFSKLRRRGADAPLSRRQFGGLLVGKLVFVGWAIVLPAFLHPLWCVIGLYFIGAGLAGLILATVLQWAHCVEGAAFLAAGPERQRLPGTWLRTQVEATRDVHLPSWLSWYVGGLDYQIEHHLFPRYPHTLYRHLAPGIEAFCRDNRINYGRHRSLSAAVSAHHRWLRHMGNPPVEVTLVRTDPNDDSRTVSAEAPTIDGSATYRRHRC